MVHHFGCGCTTRIPYVFNDVTFLIGYIFLTITYESLDFCFWIDYWIDLNLYSKTPNICTMRVKNDFYVTMSKIFCPTLLQNMYIIFVKKFNCCSASLLGLFFKRKNACLRYIICVVSSLVEASQQ